MPLLSPTDPFFGWLMIRRVTPATLPGRIMLTGTPAMVWAVTSPTAGAMLPLALSLEGP